MTFAIRDMRPDELVHVQDCDLKCFDWSWEPDEWAVAVDDYEIKVAHWYGTPVAFAVFAIIKENNGPRTLHLFKVGVKPNFRKRKVSRLLVQEVIRCGHAANCRHIEAVVPETICDPRDVSRDISVWLGKVGFQATGLIKDYIAQFGQVEDAIKFQLKLRK